MGDVLQSTAKGADWRVVLTPHCHLFRQAGQEKPRADHVLLAKAVLAKDVLGEKIPSTKGQAKERQMKTAAGWARSPAKTDRKPDGRHWYLPGFLTSLIPFATSCNLRASLTRHSLVALSELATLLPPYAEAMQSCFTGFYAAVGIPNTRPESIRGILG